MRNQNLAASRIILSRLIQWGVKHCVISPGSRSTPLTVAAAMDPRLEKHVHFDERGAAFFALGLAKASGMPAILICTSGTAVANYLPAVVEAYQDNIPLLILSADRPPELIGVGANQAIVQEHIYGRYVKIFRNLQPPEDFIDESTLIDLVDTLLSACLECSSGPVHLNCMFREPLLPDQVDPETPVSTRYPPLPKLSSPMQGALDEEIQAALLGARRGIIVLGRGVPEADLEPIVIISTRLEWPIFADVQSPLRYQEHQNIIHHYDLLLLQQTLADLHPDMVIHFGKAFTSKRLLVYLGQQALKYLLIKADPEPVDPNHQVTWQLDINAAQLEQHLSQYQPDSNSGWLSAWQKSEADVSRFLQARLSLSRTTLQEPDITYALSQMLESGHVLMLGNSMSIREMDMFGAPNRNIQKIFVNRGASGIDGLLATAAGLACAGGQPLTLLLGDLSLLHDLNSLALISGKQLPIIIIVLNNQGGGIFNFLPIREQKSVFETYFGTPHTFSFESAAKLFNLNYAKPASLDEFRAVYQAGSSRAPLLIELGTSREDNHAYHQTLFREIRER